MNSSVNVRMHATAFLYDHLSDFPVWIRRLTPGQLEQIASVMIAWHSAIGGSSDIVPLDEVEKRTITRAITLYGGDVIKAAKALRIGKTTLYRKLRQWGHSTTNRLLIHQASALSDIGTIHCQSPPQDGNEEAQGTVANDRAAPFRDNPAESTDSHLFAPSHTPHHR